MRASSNGQAQEIAGWLAAGLFQSFGSWPASAFQRNGAPWPLHLGITCSLPVLAMRRLTSTVLSSIDWLRIRYGDSFQNTVRLVTTSNKMFKPERSGLYCKIHAMLRLKTANSS